MLDGYVQKRTRFRKTVELAVGSNNFFWEIEFVVEGNIFLNSVECHAFVDLWID